MPETHPEPPTWPDHWSAEARDAVDSTIDERPTLGGAGFASLMAAAEHLTAAGELERIAREAGMTATGSTGQLVTHPAAVEARLARQAAATILGRLTLPPDSDARSSAGRSLARARHSR